jgi:bifunctional enzyme CysN/CysC
MSELKFYLDAQEKKSVLRFITCGSVDDGKSTLIGRLLFDAKQISEDQLSILESDSQKIGTQKGEIDFALLVDGLIAEREQGITIDVAYRYFSNEKRKFIIADAPGHEQYTRNMATGASTADLAIILVDARKGVQIQTRRHSCIISQLGVKKIIFAVNKMDLIEFSEDVFNAIISDYSCFAGKLGLKDISFIPISALNGDNIYSKSENTNWYSGLTLMETLNNVPLESQISKAPFRFPVQWVNRSTPDFRGFSGTVISGKIVKGGDVVVFPSGVVSRVKKIITFDGELDEAIADQAITLVLEDEVDISRGDVLAGSSDHPELTDQLMAHILWMSKTPMLPGRSYLLKANFKTLPATITDLKYKINVNTLVHEAAKTMEINELGVCNLFLDEPIPFEPYADNKKMGSFVLIDSFSNETIAMGMIDHGLRRADNIHFQQLSLDKQARALIKNQDPVVLWFTGLSGSGKSTIANILEQRLYDRGNHTVLLDGDNIRRGLSKDLGFTDNDRVENIRRIAEVAKLMIDAGLVVIVSFISPFSSDRSMARNLISTREFVEIYIDASLDLCISRDPKGLYKKAQNGEIKNFTGIDSSYDIPQNPEIRINSDNTNANDAADQILSYLGQNNYLKY